MSSQVISSRCVYVVFRKTKKLKYPVGLSEFHRSDKNLIANFYICKRATKEIAGNYNSVDIW